MQSQPKHPQVICLAHFQTHSPRSELGRWQWRLYLSLMPRYSIISTSFTRSLARPSPRKFLIASLQEAVLLQAAGPNALRLPLDFCSPRADASQLRASSVAPLYDLFLMPHPASLPSEGYVLQRISKGFYGQNMLWDP